jgi:hypothetical protein
MIQPSVITDGSVNTESGSMKKIFNTTVLGMFAAAIFIVLITYVPQVLVLIGFLFLSYMFGYAIIEIYKIWKKK